MTELLRSNRLLFLGVIIILFNSCEEDNSLTGRKHDIPVIEIEIDEKYLWSPDQGLYIIGDSVNDSGHFTADKANYYQDWEYPAVIRYTPAGGSSPAFADCVGFRIKGACSREKALKSIGLYWRNKYGNSSMEYPLFPGSSTNQFDRLLLRNSGSHIDFTLILDAIVVQIFKDYALVDYQEYSPCVVYLNDEYWGIYSLREMITPSYFRFHYNADEDLVDLLDGSLLSPAIDDGSSDKFLDEVINFIENNDLMVMENYLTISERIDINNLIDYIIIETYVCNTDWPLNNTKWWMENREGGMHKWRWIAYDFDAAFNPNDVKKVWIGDLYGESYDNKQDPGFFIFNNLIRNENFTREFLSRYIFFLETVFDPDRVEVIVNDMKKELQHEYPEHRERWNTPPVYLWESSFDNIVKANRARNRIMKDIIYELFEEY